MLHVIGFAFVYMEDERDAEDAIRRLDNIEFGRKGRRLRVEWTKVIYVPWLYVIFCILLSFLKFVAVVKQQERARKPENSRRSSSNLRPSKTLFVINFDPYHTRTRDLERHFDPYGKILNIRIRRNFAFIQFETQEDAIKALEATNMRWGYLYGGGWIKFFSLKCLHIESRCHCFYTIFCFCAASWWIELFQWNML